MNFKVLLIRLLNFGLRLSKARLGYVFGWIWLSRGKDTGVEGNFKAWGWGYLTFYWFPPLVHLYSTNCDWFKLTTYSLFVVRPR